MKTSNVLLVLCIIFLATNLLGINDTLRLGVLETAVSVATLIAIWQDYHKKGGQ